MSMRETAGPHRDKAMPGDSKGLRDLREETRLEALKRIKWLVDQDKLVADC